MADPNFAAVAETWAFAADLCDELEKIADASIVAPLEALRNDLEGRYALRCAAKLDAFRGTAAALISPQAVRARFLDILDQFSTDQAIDKDYPGDAVRMWEALGDSMDTNNQTVNSAEFTFTAFSGSTTGNGEIIRLGTDEQGYSMEGWYPDTFTVECMQDARDTGLDGEEYFDFYGTYAGEDELDRKGFGAARQRVKSLNARDSRAYVKNPSFNNGAPAPTTGSPSTPTSLPGWTDDTGSFTNVRLDIDTVYRPTPGDSTNYSLEMVANTYIYQDLVEDNNTRIDFDVPYVVGVAVYRESSADGTLTIRLTDGDAPTSGGVNRAITITGQSNATWSRYWLVSTPAANNWPLNFNVDSLALSFQLASRTTGSIFLDDIIFAPMTRVGRHPLDARRGRYSTGHYLAICGGSTPWVRGDKKTATDTGHVSRAVNQYWIWVGGLGYLPNTTGGTETIADK